MYSILIDEWGEAYYIKGKSTSCHCLGYTDTKGKAIRFCDVQNGDIDDIAPELEPPERDERCDPPVYEPMDYYEGDN